VLLEHAAPAWIVTGTEVPAHAETAVILTLVWCMRHSQISATLFKVFWPTC